MAGKVAATIIARTRGYDEEHILLDPAISPLRIAFVLTCENAVPGTSAQLVTG
jgi:hypothetical protein